MIVVLTSCNETPNHYEIISESSNSTKTLNHSNNKNSKKDFNEYWYNGKAEITSYKLSQARYGEIHDGHAILIYVTEPFLPKEQLKADRDNENNIPVLKLNSTKNYLTGIYPYSLMSSVFSPIDINKSAVKTTFSAQEWCGQTYIQLNNREKFEIISHSYFEESGDKLFKIKKDYLENEVWTRLRISPNYLPVGKLKMIPSMEYLTLLHKEMKAYEVNAMLNKTDSMTIYEIQYPKLERILIIKFLSEFPYTIEGWEETYISGFGESGVRLTTKAEKTKTIRSDYWNKNKVSDSSLRKDLRL